MDRLPFQAEYIDLTWDVYDFLEYKDLDDINFLVDHFRCVLQKAADDGDEFVCGLVNVENCAETHYPKLESVKNALFGLVEGFNFRCYLCLRSPEGGWYADPNSKDMVYKTSRYLDARVPDEYRPVSPYIVNERVVDLFPKGSNGKVYRLFFAPDLSGNFTLDEVLESGPDYESYFRFLRDSMRGCSRLHASGIAFRDIKPSNVLLVEGRGMLIDLETISYVDVDKIPTRYMTAIFADEILYAYADFDFYRYYRDSGLEYYICGDKEYGCPAIENDVYAYGICILLGFLNGNESRLKDFLDYLKNQFRVSLKKIDDIDLLDMRDVLNKVYELFAEFSIDARAINLIADCIQPDRSKRPTIDQVIERLEGIYPEFTSERDLVE